MAKIRVSDYLGEKTGAKIISWLPTSTLYIKHENYTQKIQGRISLFQEITNQNEGVYRNFLKVGSTKCSFIANLEFSFTKK